MKTIFTLYKKRHHRIPEVNFYLLFSTSKKDQLYTDRAVGAENIIIVNKATQESLNMGDFFDKTSYLSAAGFDFEITQWLALSLSYIYEYNDYHDIGDKNSASFYSLDNNEKILETKILINPFKDLGVEIFYQNQMRTYDNRFARDIDRNLIYGKNREYLYDEYMINLLYQTPRIECYISATRQYRDDLYQGYFNNIRDQFDLGLNFNIIPNFAVEFDLPKSIKDYDNLELAGAVLHNEYFTGVSTLIYNVSQVLKFYISYVYDDENSTYDKFTYNRNVFLGGVHYLID